MGWQPTREQNKGNRTRVEDRDNHTGLPTRQRAPKAAFSKWFKKPAFPKRKKQASSRKSTRIKVSRERTCTSIDGVRDKRGLSTRQRAPAASSSSPKRDRSNSRGSISGVSNHSSDETSLRHHAISRRGRTWQLKERHSSRGDGSRGVSSRSCSRSTDRPSTRSDEMSPAEQPTPGSQDRERNWGILFDSDDDS